jgi:hypothetical protein
MRWPRRRLATVVALTVLVAGCSSFPFYSKEVAFTFDNRTDVVLCYFPSPQDAAGARCLQELKPRAKTHWLPGCGRGTKDEVDSNPITVVITVKKDGREIYIGRASCGEWNHTKRRFVIEQQGEEFLVTDSLTSSTPSP